MKGKILTLLRQDSQVISGEALSAELGISRVSVWKHIQALRQAGYDIAGTAKGYGLKSEPDTPFGWEFGARENQIFYCDRVTSTMDVARTLSRKGCPSMTVVVADRQTRGRGRLKRQWRSQVGGLYFTVVTRPAVGPMLAGRLNFYAAAVLAQTLSEHLQVAARVKWPNDILVGEKKLCGLLAEMAAEGDQVDFVNIGIGINVNNAPQTSEPQATDLKTLVGRDVSRKHLLAVFLDRFESELAQATEPAVIERWKRYAATLQRSVKVVTTRGTFYGKAVDVDDQGGLIIVEPSGARRTVVYGDCFHQAPAGSEACAPPPHQTRKIDP